MNDKVWRLLGLPTTIVASFTAIWIALGWAEARPVTERQIHSLWVAIETVSKGLMLIEWQNLDALREKGNMSVVERSRYCSLSEILKFQAPGCR